MAFSTYGESGFPLTWFSTCPANFGTFASIRQFALVGRWAVMFPAEAFRVMLALISCIVRFTLPAEHDTWVSPDIFMISAPMLPAEDFSFRVAVSWAFSFTFPAEEEM